MKGKLSKFFGLITDRIFNERVRAGILEAVPFWIAALITGVVAVGYTWIFNWSESISHQLLGWRPEAIFVLAPLNYLLAWTLVQSIAPGARGSGIPQVMAAIDMPARKYKQSVSRLLSLRIIGAKIISSIFMVLGGGAIGREGPTIQIAGSVFRVVSKMIPASWPRLSQRSFILTGAAAGLAAAFNTPLGGIVFAIEELAKIHISLFRTALFTSVIIAGLAAQALLGPYLYLGYPVVKDLSPWIFGGVILAAVLSGLAGATMCRLILRVLKWKRHFSKVSTIIFIICAGLLMATIAYFFDAQVLGSGKELMNDLLFHSNKGVDWQTAAGRFIGPVISFSVGGAGGIFAPSLAAGAAVGGLIADLIGLAGSNANILILAGMVGFLTGVTRTPFTSAILVLEMTDRHSVIFHLMLAALVASLVALIIDKRSFYGHLRDEYMGSTSPDKNQHTHTEQQL